MIAALFTCQSAAASSMYLCRDARGKKYYSNMPESGRCVSYSTRKLGSISFSGKWPGYSNSSYKNVRYHKQIDYWGKRYNIDPNLIKAIIAKHFLHGVFALRFDAVPDFGKEGMALFQKL